MKTSTERSYRSEFTHFVNEENSNKVKQAFDWFCGLCKDEAFDILWDLTYKENIGFEMPKELRVGIPLEGFATFMDELCYQYEQEHGLFMESELPFECQKEFDALKEVGSVITAKRVHDSCTEMIQKYGVHPHLGESYAYSMAPFSRRVYNCLYLLECKEERYYYDAICWLGFTREEANYLKNFKAYIYNLFDALVKEQEKNSANKPLASVATMLNFFDGPSPES